MLEVMHEQSNLFQTYLKSMNPPPTPPSYHEPHSTKQSKASNDLSVPPPALPGLGRQSSRMTPDVQKVNMMQAPPALSRVQSSMDKAGPLSLSKERSYMGGNSSSNN